MACLDWGGTAPEQRELFTILVIRGSSLEKNMQNLSGSAEHGMSDWSGVVFG